MPPETIRVGRGIRNVSLHGELLGGWGITLSEAIKHLLETGQKLVQSHYFGGIGIRGQSDRLANGRDCASDASSLDLFSLTVVALRTRPAKPARRWTLLVNEVSCRKESTPIGDVVQAWVAKKLFNMTF